LLGSLTSEEITLTIDPGGVQPGKSVKVPVAVEIPERLRNLGVEAVWRPQTIPVKLISDARRQLPVEVEPLDKPEGWELKAPPQTTPAQVAISGAQQDVALVHRLRATLPLKPSEWVSELSSVRAEDAEGNDITDLVKPTPAQVKVTATLERVVLQKDVPIQPVFRVPPGVRVTAEVIPPLVRLIGPERRLSSVYVVETTPFEVPAGKAQFTKTITLVLPGAGITMRPDSVKVIIRTQAAATARPVR
jgi:YbbR domain-containing protein